MDNKLTWQKHIHQIKAEATKSLNLLKVLSSTSWGTDRRSMLRLYQSLILPKIDYGSIIYSSSKEKLLQALEPVQNNALRLALGAFKSSPVASLQCETSIPPLKFRRQKLILNHFAKIMNNRHHPLFQICKSQSHPLFTKKAYSSKPFAFRAKQGIILLNHVLPEFPVLNDLLLPPWCIPPIKKDLTLKEI